MWEWSDFFGGIIAFVIGYWVRGAIKEDPRPYKFKCPEPGCIFSVETNNEKVTADQKFNHYDFVHPEILQMKDDI